jgi:phosphatidylinositol glycan class O
MSKVSTVYIGLVCILIWLTFMHFSTLFGFSEGYLKTRAHLNKHSQCEDVESLYTLPNKKYLEGLGRNESCWNRRRFDHVVVLLIDSLRFDFCVMDPNYNETSQTEGHAFIDPGDQANIIRFYKNRLPVINETIWTQPDNSRLFRFVADPPTATMQRIKALTTGSMPTFLEVSDNFASEAIHDDNWVVQMGNAGRKAIFMGDDTWLSMYPTSFAKAYPYPSFEVRDLHTVDQGVQRHMTPEIRGETFGEDGWHLILGHMLGVDHVGHRLGSNHPEMALKLAEMNLVIGQVMNAIKDNTLFIVMSDHGMNYEGNHGGATFQETSASLFFFTPRKGAFANPVSSRLPNPSSPHSYGSISQIDIVPTISMLLGAPIPFGSLGMIIPELFWDSNDPSELLDPLHVNSAQLLRYLSELEKNDNRFPTDEMKHLRALFNNATSAHASWQLSGMPSSSHDLPTIKNILELYKDFHSQAVDMCRRLWTTFDTDKMSLNSFILMATSLVPGFLTLANTRSIHRTMFYVSVGLFWAPLTYLVGWKSRDFPLTLDWILFVAQVGSLCSFVLAFVMEFEVFFPSLSFSSLRKWVKSLRHNGLSLFAGLLFIVLLITRCASLTSNSFIINAQQTNTFMTSSLAALLMIISLRNGQTRIAQFLLVALVLNRLTYHTFAGRHENYFVASSYIDLTIYTIAPLLILTFCTIVLVRKWLAGNLWILLLLVIPQVALMVYWIVQSIGVMDQWIEVRLYIPWLIYGSSLSHLTYLIITPFIKASSIFALHPPNPSSPSTDGGATNFHTDGRHVTVRSVKFLMRANFSRMALALLPTILLVLGPASPLPVLALFITAIAIASASSTALHTAPVPSFSLIALAALLWSYLAYTHFYATSHLPVFTALQMSAAFIGVEGFSLYFGGLLVGFNAMFSHLVLAISVPILGCNLFHFDETTIHQVVLIYNFIYSATAAATCGSSYMHRRHLFVWTVFAPFFLFESLTLITVDIGLLIGVCIAFASSRQTAPKSLPKTKPLSSSSTS